MKSVDVFPAVLKIAPADSLFDFTALDFTQKPPDGTRRLDRCRVVIVENTLMVAVDSPQGPELVFREKVSAFSSYDDLHHARTESAKIMVFKKDRNCGCGSQLRTWQPYKHLYSNEDA